MSIRKRKAQATWTLVDVMRARGVTSLRMLHERLSKHIVISYDRTRRLATGRFENREILEALCKALECGIADILPINYTRDRTLEAALQQHRAKRRPTIRHVDVVGKQKPLGDPTGIEPVSI